MRPRAGLVLMVLLPTIVAAAPALAQTAAQTPIDGRIVRVVYKVIFEGGGPKNATWGFHLAHMSDGRYCVRFGDPGRLALANIRRTNDICFETIPGQTERSSERSAPSYAASDQGKEINVTVFHKGTVQLIGNDVTLDIAACAAVEGEEQLRCFPNRYVVRMSGDTCTALIILTSRLTRADEAMCEHYKAE
jgi:hypothetical protein